MDVIAVPMSRSDVEPKPNLVSRADPEPRRRQRRLVPGAALPQADPQPAASIAAAAAPASTRRRGCCSQAEVDVDGTNLTVVGTHFSHLEFGAVLQTRALRRGLPPADRPGGAPRRHEHVGLDDRRHDPAGLAPRRSRARRGRRHRPRHQIDHLLVTPSVEVVRREVLPDAGSDHRPIRARLRVT